MIVDDPKVTLDWEGHGIPADARDAPFLDWLCSVVARGDDGNTYWFGTSPLILGLEGVDMWNIEASWETGTVRQLPGSIFKVADFPSVGVAARHTHPAGTLQVERSDHEVTVRLPGFQVICRDDHSWHYTIEDAEKGIRAEFVHQGTGYPTWYGKETPSYLTPHSIAYGYNWSGRVEGKLTIAGREVDIVGTGIRERYVAVDSSAAEIGGWEDWAWFHFDEAHGSMYDMKLGQKDFSINLPGDGLYLPAGDFAIEHEEWAWLPQLGAFIPTRYRVRFETEAGVLELSSDVVGATVWGVTGKAPSTPVATLNWDNVQGAFTYTDGRRRTLTNGMGGVSIRQIKPYPDVLGAVLGAHGAVEADGRMTTL
ncbi:hypothetical protein [Propionicicella superfundia]|uniref:hypothetical protein n=1 Tax=Propionicicella superfundia TaxID=348582 RepID=UPI000418CBF5|nr:hypothetical protein [Propionicicella superfundia]